MSERGEAQARRARPRAIEGGRRHGGTRNVVRAEAAMRVAGAAKARRARPRANEGGRRRGGTRNVVRAEAAMGAAGE